MIEAFDFGRNWKHYSARVLTRPRVEGAREAFSVLTSGIELKSRAFLDVGFGQGLTALCAADAGAVVCCLDVNPRCVEALELTGQFFLPEAKERLNLIVGSILSSSDVRQLREKSGSGYDVVHSWGVLHHTGDLQQAFANCADLVKPGGHLIVAIYNRHWSSPLWKCIKGLYCRLPRIGQKTMIGLFVPVIYLAKLLVTRRNPLEKERGMDFLVDIVDWVGGYPYEYATIDEVLDLGAKNSLQTLRVTPAGVPTGCNEFVFNKPA
jgi:SAM-dependent methyltransferase